ncbi:MAG: hypothetical protein IT291_10085 [Deltaproteobacteria bacterium]|nr:hypothetical protein [Deltaproteobacteria bacterium]
MSIKIKDSNTQCIGVANTEIKPPLAVYPSNKAYELNALKVNELKLASSPISCEQNEQADSDLSDEKPISEIASLKSETRSNDLHRLQEDFGETAKVANEKLSHAQMRIGQLEKDLTETDLWDWAAGRKSALKSDLQAAKDFYEAQKKHCDDLQKSLANSKILLNQGLESEQEGALLARQEKNAEAQVKFSQAQEAFRQAAKEVSNKTHVNRNALQRYSSSLEGSVHGHENVTQWYEKAATTATVVRNTTVVAGATIATGGAAGAMMAAGYGAVAAGAVGFGAGFGAGSATGGISNVAKALSEMAHNGKSAAKAFGDAGLNTLSDAKTAAVSAASMAVGVGAASQLTPLLSNSVSLVGRAITGAATGGSAAVTSTALNTGERYVAAVKEFNSAFDHLPVEERELRFSGFMQERGLSVSHIARNAMLDIAVGGVAGSIGGGSTAMRDGLGNAVAKGIAFGSESMADLGVGICAANLRANIEGRDLTYEELVQEVASTVRGSMQGAVGARAATKIKPQLTPEPRQAEAATLPELPKWGTGEDTDMVARWLSRVDQTLHCNTALMLIDAGKFRAVLDNIRRCSNLNAEVAFRLIDATYSEHSSFISTSTSVDIILRSIDESLHADVVDKLLRAGQFEAVFGNLNKFRNLNHNDIAITLLNAGELATLANNLGHLRGLDPKIANKLIDDEYVPFKRIFEHSLAFVDLKLSEIAYGLIVRGRGYEARLSLAPSDLNFDTPIAEFRDLMPVGLRDLIGVSDVSIGTLGELYEFCKDHEKLVKYLGKTPSEHLRLSREEIASPMLGGVAAVDPVDAEILKRAGIEFANRNVDLKEAFDILSKQSPNWSDWTSANNFRSAADVFGYDRMFAYLKTPDTSIHDALYSMNDILRCYRSSGISAESFYNNILQQVRNDDQRYESGSAHDELNSIANALDLERVNETLEVASRYKDLADLSELATILSSKKEVFSSWSNLKRYDGLRRLMNDAEILDDLRELKAEGHDSLYRFVNKLAFHKDSRVDMNKVTQFWREPESFLGLQDDEDHTPRALHDSKKPSNYIDIPHLDLTAKELRNALVDGVLDKVQVFSPLEVVYKFRSESSGDLSVRERLRDALGSRSDVTHWNKSNAARLFQESNKVLSENGNMGSNAVKQYLNGSDISKEVEIALEDLLGRKELNARAGGRDISVVARIHPKSSPEGVLAGNDTACCMHFGSGKNNIYMFNPNTALFTVEVHNGDGKKRTIAQSVLTMDKDVGKSVAEIIKEANLPKARIEQILPQDVLRETKTVLACDNVEVAPNYRDSKYAKIIEASYRDFFFEYMNRYGKQQGLKTDAVVIGMRNSDALQHLPQAENNFIPLAPVGYSDKVDADVYELKLDGRASSSRVRTVASDLDTPERSGLNNKSVGVAGVSALSFTDALPVSYIEGKDYHDNRSLIEYLHNMENGLIAVAINNTQKERPNLSVKYTDPEGRMRGYLFAYEGKMGDSSYDDGDSFGKQEPVVYVADFAVVEDSKLAAGKMLNAFTNLYNENYLKRGKVIPIYASMRERTSYKIMQRHLDRIANDIGIKFEVEEIGSNTIENDNMHQVVIRPILP